MPFENQDKYADSEEDYSSSSSVSYKGAKDDKHKGEGSDTLITNDRSSTSDTVSETKGLTNKSTPTSRTLPASLAGRSKKKAKRIPCRGKFLEQLRVLLDRESEIDSTIVKWSADGRSFIIRDKFQFETDVIPTYFDGDPIIFPSFLNKLSRWGFQRMSNKKNGSIEFSSPTFTRFSASSALMAAATNISVGMNDSFQRQAQTSSLAAMARNNQPPLSNANPQQSNVAAIMNLISNIQNVSQQLNIPSQQPAQNQNTNTDAASDILQSIMRTIQQPSQTQQQPTPAPAPAMNLFNNYGRSQTTSSNLPEYPQGNALNTLMSLSGMLSQQSTHPNSNSAASMPRLNNNMSVQSLLALLGRVREEERQRRAQADETKNAIVAKIVEIIGLTNSIAEVERQLGSRGIQTATTTHVPHNIAFHPQQFGRPPSAAVNPNAQASSSNNIAAILQAIRNVNAGQLKDDREDSNGN